MAKKKYNQQPDLLQTFFLGFIKGLWWLIKLPFGQSKSGRRGGLSVDQKSYLVRERLKIEAMLGSASSIELKHALIEADKLVDHTLKLQGYSGATFADRLRSAQPRINQNLNNEIWQGHKVRNNIVHEQGNTIGNSELRSAAEKLLRYIKSI